MRNRIVLLLMPLLTAASVRAEGIRYDLIPSDVSGYAYVDIGHILSSHFITQTGDAKGMATVVNSLFGEHAEITFYTPKSGGYVWYWHTADAEVRKRVEASVTGSKTAVAITYGDQKIYYTSDTLQALLSVPGNLMASPHVQPKEAKPSPSNFSMGLGLGDMKTQSEFEKGPTYVAFVGDDLMIFTGDLPSITNALDVMHGKAASLMKQDPQGLKMDVPAGAMVVGAGLTASLSTLRTTQPNNPPASDNFHLDLFGPLKAHARLAQFAMGEDDRQIFGYAQVTMSDADSAEQLKNLIVGVKGLISLSKTARVPLLDALDIDSTDKSVTLHWSWPIEKLPELLRLTEASSDGHAIANTQPVH